MSDELKINVRGNKFPLVVAGYVGFIEVLDAQKMLEAYVDGVGRHRCFGCGMMNLKRVA